MKFLPKLLTTLLVSTSSLTLALPTKTPHCANLVSNPTFSSGSLSPWLDIVTGSWATRGITPTPSHTNIYTAHSNSTIVTATLTLSQSSLSIPAGTSVDCYAWVHTERPTGYTRVDVFLDQVRCGGSVTLGPGSSWTRVGGTVVAVGEGDEYVGHTVAVSVQGDGVVGGGGGWSVDVGEVGIVGEGC